MDQTIAEREIAERKRKCPYCGDEFIAHNMSLVYCPEKNGIKGWCKSRYHNNRYKLKNVPPKKDVILTIPEAEREVLSLPKSESSEPQYTLSSSVYKRSGSRSGTLNFREKKMIADLINVIDAEKMRGALFEFHTISDYDDLKTLHTKCCVYNTPIVDAIKEMEQIKDLNNKEQVEQIKRWNSQRLTTPEPEPEITKGAYVTYHPKKTSYSELWLFWGLLNGKIIKQKNNQNQKTMETNYAYEKLMAEKNLQAESLPLYAKIGIEAIKDLEKVNKMRAKKGLGVTESIQNKIKYHDSTVCSILINQLPPPPAPAPNVPFPKPTLVPIPEPSTTPKEKKKLDYDQIQKLFGTPLNEAREKMGKRTEFSLLWGLIKWINIQ
jgi:hypothetical protein